LSAQVNDLQAKLLSAAPSNSSFEVHAKAVDPSVENVKKLVDDSIQQQVRRALSRQSATGGAAIAALTRPKTSNVMMAPSPALSHLGNDVFFRHNFAAPSKNRSSEALPPFTKARQPQCECSCRMRVYILTVCCTFVSMPPLHFTIIYTSSINARSTVSDRFDNEGGHQRGSSS